MTKHDAMVSYMTPKVQELVGRLLNFNVSPGKEGNISFLTNYSDKLRKKYIRVGVEKEYGFTVLITRTFSEETDDLNLDAMNFSQGFMDWIDEQEKKKNYPDFGEKCQVKKIENLQNMPNLASVDWENMIAQYMLQCRVIYFEKHSYRE